MSFPNINRPAYFSWKKVLSLSTFLVVLILVASFLFYTKAKHDPKYYYDLIRNQEAILDTTTITDQEKEALVACKSSECFRSFYDAYTMKHGVEQAFSHLALLQKEVPETKIDCHYISHGIGHAALRLNHDDVYKTFSVMQSSKYFKNVATCGNGYFHGVIEEFAKNTKGVDDLVRLLEPICKGISGYCYHGIGHALYLQLDEDPNVVQKALKACDSITDIKENRFECYTGIFMQEASPLFSVEVKDGVMHFDVCDKQDLQYKTACYLEQSSLYERFSDEPLNYVRNIGFCKQIVDELDRMACVKLFAIRSVRIARFEDVKDMCANTSSQKEGVVCTAVAASKIAGSMDSNAPEYDYKKVILDICSTITNPFGRLDCFNFVTMKKNQLFYTSKDDLSGGGISLNTIKNVYKVSSRNN